MENKRGSEIFLGVVGVATLIVAIIGATFAFFSASIQGDNNVNVESYTYSATLSVERVDNASGLKLIPMKSSEVDNALATADSICKTTDGFAGCALYKLTFTNTGSGALTLDGVLTTTKNEGVTETTKDTNKFENLKYQMLTSTDGTTFTKDGAAVAISSSVDGTANMPQVVGISNAEGSNTAVRYVLVYLEDTGAAQPTEMGVSYEGTFTYSSGDATSGLTASFGIGG